MKSTFTWSGFKEFEDLFDEINEDFGEKDAKNILRNSCRESMKPVLESARELLQSHGNVDTGQLLRSLQIEARKPTSRDRHSAYVTPTMLFISRVTVAPGSKFDPDEPKLRKKTFVNKKTGLKQHMISDARAIAIEFGTAKWLKGEGRPFIRPALENNAQGVTDVLSQNLKNALIKYQSKHMDTKK
jgi:hypothetical protein